MVRSAFGMQLHAATTVDGRDHKQLERLCRSMLRPPFAHGAVQALQGGRVRVHCKAPWRSGADHADMSPDSSSRACVASCVWACTIHPPLGEGCNLVCK